MKNDNAEALHKTLKLTRNLMNISFILIFLVLLFWGGYNPAAIFAIIFYNALYWLLLLNSGKNTGQTKGSGSSSEVSELNILKLTLPVGLFLHILLGYGFMHKLPIKIEELKYLPFALAAIIILFRYLGYFVIKIKLKKNNR